MMKSVEGPRVCLNDLIRAARRGEWGLIDAAIPPMANDSEVISWVWGKGIGSKDGNLRDLAVSILEKSSYELKPENREKLRELLKGDENPYVQFRAAFTLFNRGDRSGVVIDKLYEATGNEDVCQIAQGYLAQLQS